MKKEEFRLKLKGKTAVYIDWANVHGWEKSLRKEIDTHQALKEGYQSFVFLTGDGDFEPLYKMLISLRKQVVVIFAHGHMGREIYQIKKGIFTKAIDKLGGDLFA